MMPTGCHYAASACCTAKRKKGRWSSPKNKVGEVCGLQKNHHHNIDNIGKKYIHKNLFRYEVSDDILGYPSNILHVNWYMIVLDVLPQFA